MNNNPDELNGSDIRQFLNKLGLILENVLQHFQVIYFNGFTFLPDMAIHFGTLLVKDDFTRVTGQSDLTDGIGFVFHNIIADNGEGGTEMSESTAPIEAPYVRIFPYAIRQTLHFKKNTRVSHVSISVSAAYLRGFLKEEAQHFGYLFDSANNFWIEELMTDDILRTVNDLVKRDGPGSMTSFYYKMKATELLYHLFTSLKNRARSGGLRLNAKDISAVYQVRDKMVSSLSRPSYNAELKQIAGMNELKLRKIFTQVFGVGIYEYYQHLRMKDAARLLREERISVSEVGYRMGFENLGHFTKIFERHIGKKPKQYSNDLGS